MADVNIGALIEFHKQSARVMTLTAVQPTGRYGSLKIGNDGSLTYFAEKPKGEGIWVSGGFFVLSPKVGAYLKDDTTIWERAPIEAISREGNVAAYKHHGFWQAIDTSYDKAVLEELWKNGSAPWKIWE